MNRAVTRRPVLGVDFHVWDGIFQGSRSHLLGLYRAAIPLAPEIDFVFFLDQPEALRRAHVEFAASHVRLVRMPHRPGPWRLAWQLPWLRWRHGVDLLHMQYRLPLLPAGACACTIHDVLYETHPQFFTRFFVWQSRLTGRQAARAAQLLFTVSAYSRDQIVRLYGVDRERVAITCNGVDFERFAPGAAGAAAVTALGLTPGGYLLTLGRLEPRKNHLTLLRAYAQLASDAPPLVIVGQRDFHYGAVFDEIKRLQLDARVRVLETVDDATLPAVLRHALLFVYPAYAEGFGMPVAEAMASGVPVITSNTTALPEVAGPGALLVDPSSPEQLAQAMARLLVDADGRRRLVQVGLQHVRQFDWQASAATFVAALRRHFQHEGP
ncbi:MAG: glycosyltransferase family 1 protein [Rubrivivax sp.]|nr:glycosyltransferase family 1 protein [Rubrivivax sp.]